MTTTPQVRDWPEFWIDEARALERIRQAGQNPRATEVRRRLHPAARRPPELPPSAPAGTWCVDDGDSHHGHATAAELLSALPPEVRGPLRAALGAAVEELQETAVRLEGERAAYDQAAKAVGADVGAAARSLIRAAGAPPCAAAEHSAGLRRPGSRLRLGSRRRQARARHRPLLVGRTGPRPAPHSYSRGAGNASARPEDRPNHLDRSRGVVDRSRWLGRHGEPAPSKVGGRTPGPSPTGGGRRGHSSQSVRCAA